MVMERGDTWQPPGLGAGRRAVTSATTITTADRGFVIDATSGSFTIALDPAATLTSGFFCVVYNSGSGTVVLDPSGVETIRLPLSAASTLTLLQGQGVALSCTGTDFEVVSSSGYADDPSTATIADTLTLSKSSGTGLALSSTDAGTSGLSTGSIVSQGGATFKADVYGSGSIYSFRTYTHTVTTGYAAAGEFRHRIGANVAASSFAVAGTGRPTIAAGFTNGPAANLAAAFLDCMRNYDAAATNDSGTASRIIGIRTAFGHHNTLPAETPQTDVAIGVWVSPFGMTGTITDLYCVYLDTINTGGTVTNKWGIYQTATDCPHQLASDVGITSTTDSTSPTTGALKVSGGIGSAKQISALNYLATMGSISSAEPVFDSTVTWNSGGTTFTGVKFNVTDTASASSSLLMDLQVGGTSKMAVGKDGGIVVAYSGSGAGGINVSGTSGQNSARFSDTTNTTLLIGHASGQVRFTTGGASQALVFRVGTTEFGRFAATTGDFLSSSTSDATSITTGAITTLGGASVAKNLIAGQGLGLGVTSTVTAAGTTTLTNASDTVQKFTGTTTQTIQFPAANLFGAGVAVHIVIDNHSTGIVTPTRAGSDTFKGGGTTYPVAGGASTTFVSDGVATWGIA